VRYETELRVWAWSAHGRCAASELPPCPASGSDLPGLRACSPSRPVHTCREEPIPRVPTCRAMAITAHGPAPSTPPPPARSQGAHPPPILLGRPLLALRLVLLLRGWGLPPSPSGALSSAWACPCMLTRLGESPGEAWEALGRVPCAAQPCRRGVAAEPGHVCAAHASALEREVREKAPMAPVRA